MSRNSLVVESLKKPEAGRSVWSMCMTVIGGAFGASVSHPRGPGR